MKDTIREILAHCGLNGFNTTAVHGGDINQCYRVSHQQQQYFLKTNHASNYPAMLQKEAVGLSWLREHSSFKVPAVIDTGEIGSTQYLLLEWIAAGVETTQRWATAGEALARMHQCTRALFGFEDDNYIGSLHQSNQPCSSWHEFYSTQRLLPLTVQLYEQQQISHQWMLEVEKLCAKLQTLFPAEPPALLHGDLWSGNILLLKNGNASIFDPAVYYGHREMDIGITRLFGGFPPAFYDAYDAIYPLQQGWQQRLALTQLYPLLVHACLFGGHYTAKAMAIVKQFA